MSVKNSLRIPIGFLAGLLFIWRADPAPASFALGAALIALGEVIRFVGSGTIKKFEGVTSNGVYKYTRNPLYIGSFILGAGACVMSRDWLFSAMFFVFFILLYSRVIIREERYLVGRYGDDYVRYLAEVPRLIPRSFDIAYVLRETSPRRAIKNKEGKTLAGIAGLLAAMVVKMMI